LREQLALYLKAVQFVQGALPPLPDWNGDVLVDPSRQSWFGKIASSPGATCPLDQSEERKSVMFEAPFDGIDGIEGERLSTDYHRG
jgi:hypothetical protein